MMVLLQVQMELALFVTHIAKLVQTQETITAKCVIKDFS
jgi:hypothetical protein